MAKLGRPPIMPKPDGTLHAAAKWENRLWIHEQSLKYGITYGQVVDELVESLRVPNRLYNPGKISDAAGTRPIHTIAELQYKRIMRNPKASKDVIRIMDRVRRDH